MALLYYLEVTRDGVATKEARDKGYVAALLKGTVIGPFPSEEMAENVMWKLKESYPDVAFRITTEPEPASAVKMFLEKLAPSPPPYPPIPRKMREDIEEMILYSMYKRAQEYREGPIIEER